MKMMNDPRTQIKDPICGMNMDEATDFYAEREGMTFYFCCDNCLQTFLSTPREDNSGRCCG